MSPLRFTLLHVFFTAVGAFAGGVGGLALSRYEAAPLPFVVVGAVGGALGVYISWQRWVPIRCPACRGRMKKTGWSRSDLFACESCGRQQAAHDSARAPWGLRVRDGPIPPGETELRKPTRPPPSASGRGNGGDSIPNASRWPRTSPSFGRSSDCRRLRELNDVPHAWGWRV
jgi:hypothetical protein